MTAYKARQGLWRRALVIGIFWMALAMVWGCNANEVSQPLRQVKVQLVWKHQAQFAGFYAADQRGYYAAEGLQVGFIPRSKPTSNVFENTVEGAAHFGVGYGVGLITSRDQGLPVQAIACIFRYYPLVFITLKSSDIDNPQDFPGHTIRALTPGGAEIAFRAMMSRLGLDANSVRPIEMGFKFEAFLTGTVDIWPGYVTNEVLLARKQGVAVHRILPSDYGVHLYGDTLFTTDQLIQEDPDLVLRFLRATLRGWQWAVENAEAAGPMSLAYAPGLDAQHQIDQMRAAIPLIDTGHHRIGMMQGQVWEDTHRILMAQKILQGPVDLSAVYTTRFLHKIYPKAE